MRIVILVGCLTLTSTAAAAQTWEVGGSLAAACIGSDGSICSNSGDGPLVGAHVSRWFDDRIEIAGRWSRVALSPFEFNPVFPVALHGAVTDRSRQFLSATFVYHFRHELSVRPMLGGGTGLIRQTEQVACEPFRCAEVPGLPPEGTHRTWKQDLIFVVGLSGTPAPRWVWRLGWQGHRFGNDHNGTSEFFASVGYRFGRR